METFLRRNLHQLLLIISTNTVHKYSKYEIVMEEDKGCVLAMGDRGGYNQGHQQQYQGYGQHNQAQGYYQQGSQQFQASYQGYGSQASSHGNAFFQPAQQPPQDQQTSNLFGAALPSAQLGIQLGTQALSVGQDYVNKNVLRTANLNL